MPKKLNSKNQLLGNCQFYTYFLKYFNGINEVLITYIYLFNFFRVHIRRTDKVGTEAAFHKLDEYMTHVEQYYKQRELSEKIDKKRVYLATDEPKLFSEAKKKYLKQ